MRANILVIGLAISGMACVSSGKYDQAMEELKKTQDDLKARQGELAQTKARVTELEGQLSTTSSEKDAERTAREGSEKRYSASQKELEQLRAQLAETHKRLVAFQAITKRFQAMIDAGKIKVGMRKGQMIMQLPSGVLFASGKDTLSKEGEATITEVANVLKDFTDRKFLITGHTDNVPIRGGKFQDNWELSAARAVTVARFLIMSGVPPAILGAAGYSEYDLVADNGTEAGRQENRRIEIVLLPNLEEMPKLPAN
ncbi:MAG TPA: OmpA family protein [Haliangiales bacterium]|nr:OmpA family protein [Haliangiales bacterium]